MAALVRGSWVPARRALVATAVVLTALLAVLLALVLSRGPSSVSKQPPRPASTVHRLSTPPDDPCYRVHGGHC